MFRSGWWWWREREDRERRNPSRFRSWHSWHMRCCDPCRDPGEIKAYLRFLFSFHSNIEKHGDHDARCIVNISNLLQKHQFHQRVPVYKRKRVSFSSMISNVRREVEEIVSQLLMMKWTQKMNLYRVWIYIIEIVLIDQQLHGFFNLSSITDSRQKL